MGGCSVQIEDKNPSVEEISRTIQRGLLPTEAPRIQGFDIAAGTSLVEDGPGRTLWDFFTLKGGRTGLVNLNVQGSGLPPARTTMAAGATRRTAPAT